MSLVVLIGGARSGKSRLAQSLASEQGAPVVFVATGEALDDEMTERIARHREERPAGWTTVEEPVALEHAIASAPAGATVVVDCLSLWLSNLLLRGDDPAEILTAVTGAASAAAARPGLTVCVTNEVGLGVVPATPLGRSFRDLQGAANRIWVEASVHAAFVVAGRALALQNTSALLGRAT